MIGNHDERKMLAWQATPPIVFFSKVFALKKLFKIAWEEKCYVTQRIKKLLTFFSKEALDNNRFYSILRPPFLKYQYCSCCVRSVESGNVRAGMENVYNDDFR